MDINRKNFEECLPIVSNAISEATFIAIDTEFTGLDDGSHITGLDTPEKRYFKLLKPAKDYLIIQFGLSIFKKMPGHSKYEVKSFNFSIFPRTTRFTPNVSLKFQGPSLEFVTYQGLDFDEIVEKGLPYLSAEAEERMRNELLEKHARQIRESHSVDRPTPSVVPHWTKDFVEKQIKRVESAVDVNCRTVALDACDLLTKHVLFEQLESRFPNQLLLEADSRGGVDSVVVMVTIVDGCERKREVLTKRHEEEMEDLQRVLGFTKIIKLLHESNKLIVGHNMLFDVMHTINQFWSNLPSDYKSFKGLVHQVFPRILDTKHMASVEPFKTVTNNRNLKELYDDLKTNKKISSFVIEIPEEFPDYMSQTNFHNAAYDAFITGICFLLMKSYLGAVQKHLTMDEKLSSYENKLYLMRIVDVPYMDLAGDDLPLTTRDHIFHVQFYKNKKMSDLKNLFAPFGDVDIKFIDENSAFVCMLDKEKSTIASKKLSSPKDSWYKLQPLAEWYSSRSDGPHPCHGSAVHQREGQTKRKFCEEDEDDEDGSKCSFGLDVTQENFEESLVLLSQAMAEASFVAVATEALGFNAKKYMTEFDTPRGRYQKLLEPVREHLVVQFGVCTFKKLAGHKKYEAKPFNFSVYPKSSKLAPDVFFKSENSKLEVDSKRGFKIKKIVSEGISYLSLANERNLCDRLLAKQNVSRQELNRDNHNSCQSILVPLSKQEFVDRQIRSVEAMMSSRSEDHVTLEPCNSFIRKLLYEQLNLRFPDQLFIETVSSDSSSPLIRVTFVDSSEHRKELEMQKQDKKLEELHRALGFTRVIKMIHDSNKLIVGHNMLLDIMHSINQFWSNLPSDYKSFKSIARQIFPRVLDTRHMASTEPFKGLMKSRELHKLHEELRAVKKAPAMNIQIADDHRKREPRNPDFRNSALSAYESGVCFLLMKSHLGTLQKNISIEEKIGSYENRLHLENMEDVPFVNLEGEDLAQSREHVYHFKLKKKNKCLSEAINVLANHGKFRLLDETSALLHVHDNDKLAAVVQSLSVLKEGSYKLQPFEEWRLARDQGQGASVLRESPPNLKRKHDDDNKTLGKKIPAKRKQKLPNDGLTVQKKNGGSTDPSTMFHFEPKKPEGVQKPALFEVPDEWD